MLDLRELIGDRAIDDAGTLPLRLVTPSAANGMAEDATDGSAGAVCTAPDPGTAGLAGRGRASDQSRTRI
jgi:hypothetical protein